MIVGNSNLKVLKFLSKILQKVIIAKLSISRNKGKGIFLLLDEICILKTLLYLAKLFGNAIDDKYKQPS